MRSLPELLLVCHVRPITRNFGWWWFSLQQEAEPLLVAHDYEQLRPLELHQLCLVRGLEAIEGPARVHLALSRGESPARLKLHDGKTPGANFLLSWEESLPCDASWQRRLQRCWAIHQVELLPRLPWDLGTLLDSGSRSTQLIPRLAWRWFKRLPHRRSLRRSATAPARRWLQSA